MTVAVDALDYHKDPIMYPSSMSVERGARTADQGNFDLSGVDRHNGVASVGCTEN